MAIPYATYKLKILNIKYYKNNRLNKNERNKAIGHNNYPHIENKFQVEIEALVYNIKYSPNFNVNEKFHKNIKTIIRVNFTFYKSRHQYEAYLINNGIAPFPYKLKKGEVVCGETEKLHGKFEFLKRGDKLKIRSFNQFLSLGKFDLKTNIIKNKGEDVYIQDIIDGRYEFKNNIIQIDKLREKNENNGFDVDDFNIIKSDPISKIWSYIQYKIPAIPQLQYHVFYRYVPLDQKIRRYISIPIIIIFFFLTIYPNFPNATGNLIMRLIATSVLILKEFI